MSAGSKLLASSMGIWENAWETDNYTGSADLAGDSRCRFRRFPVRRGQPGCSRRATKSLIASLAMSGCRRAGRPRVRRGTGFNQRWQFGGKATFERMGEFGCQPGWPVSRRTCRAGRLWSGCRKYFLGHGIGISDRHPPPQLHRQSSGISFSSSSGSAGGCTRRHADGASANQPARRCRQRSSGFSPREVERLDFVAAVLVELEALAAGCRTSGSSLTTSIRLLKRENRAVHRRRGSSGARPAAVARASRR